MEEKEIVLKLKLNTHKQLSKIIRNELKMSKENLEDLVKQQVLDCIEKMIMQDDGYLDLMFRQRLAQIISSKFNKGGRSYNFDTLVDKMIADKYDSVIDEKVNTVVTKEVLKEYFKDK